MAVLIEAINLVIRADALERRYPGGIEALLENPPNPSICADRHLCRIGFIDAEELERFVDRLERCGLAVLVENRFVDAAVVDQVQGLAGDCDWLDFAGAAGRPVYCWLRGADPGAVMVPEDWEYETSLSRRFGRTTNDFSAATHRFLRTVDGVDIYEDSSTGEEVFFGRADR